MGNDGGLFKDLRGEINNLNVENYTNEKAKNYRVGLVEYLKGGTINNVHVNKANIKIDLAIIIILMTKFLQINIIRKQQC